jgi:hypothetical protein
MVIVSIMSENNTSEVITTVQLGSIQMFKMRSFSCAAQGGTD